MSVSFSGTREDEDELNQVEVPVLSNGVCQDWFFEHYGTNILYTESAICVGYQERRAGSCSVRTTIVNFDGKKSHQLNIAGHKQPRVCKLDIPQGDRIKVSLFYQWL